MNINGVSIKQAMAVDIIKSAMDKSAVTKDELISSLSNGIDYVSDKARDAAGYVERGVKSGINEVAKLTGDPIVSREKAYARAMAEDTLNSAGSAFDIAKDGIPAILKDKPEPSEALNLLHKLYAGTEYPAKMLMHQFDPKPITGIKPPTASRLLSGGRHDRHPIDKAMSGEYLDAADDAVYNIKDYLKGLAGRNYMGAQLLHKSFNAPTSDSALGGAIGGLGLLAATNAVPIAALLGTGYGYKALKKLLRR